MSIIEDIIKVKIRDLVLYILVLVATIGSGSLILYIFKSDLFINLSTSKIILLSFGFTSPILLVNYYLSFLLHKLENIDAKLFDLDSNTYFFGAGLFTFFTFYLTIITSYLFNFSFLTFLLLILLIEVYWFFSARPFIYKKMKGIATQKKLLKFLYLFPVIILLTLIAILAIIITVHNHTSEKSIAVIFNNKIEPIFVIKLSNSEYSNCLKSDGEVKLLNTEGGKTQVEYCSPPDIGKKCSESSECVSDCIVKRNLGKISFDESNNIIGECGVAISDCLSSIEILTKKTSNINAISLADNTCRTNLGTFSLLKRIHQVLK